MSRMFVAWVAVWLVFGTACEGEGWPGEDPGAGDMEVRTSPIIVGGVDWRETASLPADGREYAASRAVALLQIPAVGSRCTAFLVAPDVLLTNNHCIGRASDARGATAAFDYEQGVSLATMRTYTCEEFLATDVGLDFTLVRCAPRGTERPGDRYGWVTLSDAVPVRGQGVYVIHQNCDYYTAPDCDYTKKISPGSVSAVSSVVFDHLADSLGGSSGAPVFDAATHAVIGLHHAGYGGQGNGRGSYNEAVLVRDVRAAVVARVPGVLDVAPPVTPPTEPAPTETVWATTVAFESPHPYADGASLARTFEVAGALRVRVHFARLETEAGYDVVTVAGAGREEALDGVRGTVTSGWFEGARVEVRFASDASVQAYGFVVDRIEYVPSDPNSPPPEPLPPADPVVDPSPGRIVASFASAHPYTNDLVLERTFRAPSASRVRLHFARLETEARYDQVTLTGGGATQVLDGTQGEVTSDWFPGTSVSVRFDSDYSVVKWGFEVDALEWLP